MPELWRHVSTVTISNPSECERQVFEVEGATKRSFREACALYMRGNRDALRVVERDVRPFHLLFAGRIERDKGLLDLLDVAEAIGSDVPAGLVVEVCGDGAAEAAWVGEVKRRHLPIFLINLMHS